MEDTSGRAGFGRFAARFPRRSADPARWWIAALERAGVPAADAAAAGAAASAGADVEVAVPAGTGAPAAARSAGAAVLAEWGLRTAGEALDLVLSELVTNAVRHGRPDAPPGYGYANVIRVRLMRRGAQVVCAVHDPSTRPPAPRDPDLLLESGRGLHLVGCFSRSWGVVPARPCGKYVWALIG
ncbi:ATP-binding protein [Nocardiopsis coralliicola]